MSKLIDADLFLEKFHNIPMMKDIKGAFDTMPPVDAAPVRHGHWNGGADDASCSACGRNLLDFFSYTEYCGVYEYPNFCPNCGARMDGKGNDNETD